MDRLPRRPDESGLLAMTENGLSIREKCYESQNNLKSGCFVLFAVTANVLFASGDNRAKTAQHRSRFDDEFDGVAVI